MFFATLRFSQKEPKILVTKRTVTGKPLYNTQYNYLFLIVFIGLIFIDLFAVILKFSKFNKLISKKRNNKFKLSTTQFLIN